MDLERVTPESTTREFLAVVLAGFGNELLPLTSDHGDEPCPKALLPVANRPMIDYILSWIEQAGIKDVLLICPAIHRPAIYHHIHSDTSASPSLLRIDIQTYDESPDTSVGTCTLLRHFSSRITEDFVLVPCDFIAPSSLPLSILLNKVRADAISDGSIATACWIAAHSPEKGAFPDEWGPFPKPTPVLWDEHTETLLHIDTTDDQDRNAEELELRMTLLTNYPQTKMSSRLQDSHVYVCKRSVLDVLHERPHFDSFREEFLPWLCKVQYQRARKEKYGRVLNPNDNAPLQALALKHSTMLTKLQNRHNHSSGEGSWNISAPPSPTDYEDYAVAESFRIGIVIHRSGAESAIRINTIPSFLEINRRVLSQTSYTLPSDPKNRALIDQKAQISKDTIIGDSTQVSGRVMIKTSVIGRHCVIGATAKIIGCILFDHCVIGDGVKLEGCILGKNTKVGSRAELLRCITQAGYEVGAGETVKSEKLDVSDWTTRPGSYESDSGNSDRDTEDGEESG